MTQYVKFALLSTSVGTATTHLLDVDGTLGAAWTPHPDFQGALYYGYVNNTSGTPSNYSFQDNIVPPSAVDEEALYMASGTPQSDFNIQVPILTQTDTTERRMGVAYRVQDNKFKTFYLLRFGRGLLSLSVVNNGTESVLGTASSGAAQALLQVSVNGSIHRAFLPGGVTLVATDTTLTLAGRAGIWAEAGTSTTQSNRLFTEFSGTVAPTADNVEASSYISSVHDAAITLNPVELVSTGTVGTGTFVAEGDITFAVLTVAATGTSGEIGGGITFDPLELAATGNSGIAAVIDGVVPIPVCEAEAAVGVGAAGAITFDRLLVEGAGGGQGGEIVFDPLELVAEAIVGVAGSIDTSLPTITSSITAVAAFNAAGALTFDPLTVSGSGEVTRLGMLDADLPPVSGQVAGSVGIVSNGAIEFDPMVVEGTIVIPLTATVSATLPRLYAALFADLGATTSWKVVSVNVQSGAVTEYENFEFNSMARFNGKYLGAGDNGIFVLEGDDDDGVNIDSSVTFPLADSGSLNQKRPADAYAHYRSVEGMLLTVAAKGESYGYDLPPNDVDNEGELEMHKAALGKGLKSVRHQFGVQNREGADFEFAALAIVLHDTGRMGK